MTKQSDGELVDDAPDAPTNPQHAERMAAAGLVQVTEDDIEALRSERGSFTRTSLDAIGVTWPPYKDWRKRIVGQWVRPERPKEGLKSVVRNSGPGDE